MHDDDDRRTKRARTSLFRSTAECSSSSSKDFRERISFLSSVGRALLSSPGSGRIISIFSLSLSLSTIVFLSNILCTVRILSVGVCVCVAQQHLLSLPHLKTLFFPRKEESSSSSHLVTAAAAAAAGICVRSDKNKNCCCHSNSDDANKVCVRVFGGWEKPQKLVSSSSSSLVAATAVEMMGNEPLR